MVRTLSRQCAMSAFKAGFVIQGRLTSATPGIGVDAANLCPGLPNACARGESMDKTVGEIAELVGGTVEGDDAVRITGVNGIKEAGPGDLSFIRCSRYLPLLDSTKASVVLVGETAKDCTIPMIVVPEPDVAFAQILQQFEQEQLQHPEGIHEQAVIGNNVQLGENVALDAFVRIADNCVIGDGAVLYSGVYVARDVIIGAGTVIFPNVSIREKTEIGAQCILHAGVCLGSDGFGFAPLDGHWAKIPQVGRVIIGDDVEIGSNTAVDRATFGVTRIGRGTKIDNLVQIGHNVQVGEHCAIAGMVGIAGSAVIGNHVRIGAGAGIAGHIEIADGVSIGGRSGVAKSVKAGAEISGMPAVEHSLQRRILVSQRRIPEMLRRIKQLERRLEQKENNT